MFKASILAATVAVTFAIPASGRTLDTLHAFCAEQGCPDGSNINGFTPLVGDALGNLYGTTPTGGKRGGTVFQLSFDTGKGKWQFKTIYGFPKDKHGASPFGRLIVDTNGALYGTTESGGAPGNGGGIVFRLNPNADRSKWKISNLYTFCPSGDNCLDGYRPLYSGVTYQGAASGVPYDGTSPLYGTTILGGKNNKGVVFQVAFDQAKGKWVETVLHDFCAQSSGGICIDGAEPDFGLTVDGIGNLFGTANEGTGNTGLIFELSPAGGSDWQYTVLYNFCGAIPCATFPRGGLLRDAAGNLYGASSGGVHANGTIFKLIPNGTNSQFVDLYDFCALADCIDGKDPEGGLVMDASGALYSTTRQGGAHKTDLMQVGGGTVYKFAGGSLKTLYSFCGKRDCNDGEYPLAGVTLDSQGNLFGATTIGGAHDNGTVFELTP